MPASPDRAAERPRSRKRTSGVSTRPHGHFASAPCANALTRRRKTTTRRRNSRRSIAFGNAVGNSIVEGIKDRVSSGEGGIAIDAPSGESEWRGCDAGWKKLSDGAVCYRSDNRNGRWIDCVTRTPFGSTICATTSDGDDEATTTGINSPRVVPTATVRLVRRADTPGRSWRHQYFRPSSPMPCCSAYCRSSALCSNASTCACQVVRFAFRSNLESSSYC